MFIIMRTPNSILQLSLIFISLFSCDDGDSSSGKELTRSLSGEWSEISPCFSCSTVTFKGDSEIELKYESDPEIYKISYSIERNSILINRLWDVGNDKKSNLVAVVFKSQDTLELKQFKLTDASSTTGFEDIQLKRIEP